MVTTTTPKPATVIGQVVVTHPGGSETNIECWNLANCATTQGPPKNPPAKNPPPRDPPPAQAPVTLADIAAFDPTTGSTVMEPNGWAVLGLEANVYSTAARHIVAGELFGKAAEVRFTPTSWHWDYGDGSVRDSTTAGGSWDSLALAEFAPTPTSHAFQRAGTFTILATVRFTAEYRVGDGPWIPIDGAVSVDAPPITVDVGTASTVLVAADCSADATSPGC